MHAHRQGSGVNNIGGVGCKLETALIGDAGKGNGGREGIRAVRDFKTFGDIISRIRAVG